MTMPESAQDEARATIAVYDRPPWWRRRRTWALAVPVVASIASLAMLYWWIA